MVLPINTDYNLQHEIGAYEVPDTVGTEAGYVLAETAVRELKLDHYKGRKHCPACKEAFYALLEVLLSLGIKDPGGAGKANEETTRFVRRVRCDQGHNLCSECGVCRCTNVEDVRDLGYFYPSGKVSIVTNKEGVRLCRRCKGD
jgi:hypothetical protein